MLLRTRHKTSKAPPAFHAEQQVRRRTAGQEGRSAQRRPSEKLRIWGDENVSDNLSSTDTNDNTDTTNDSILDIIIKFIEDFLTNLFKKIVNLIG